DLLNDIIDTYNEIKSLLFNLDTGACCPDIKSFPKHLMLGEVMKTGPCYEYRHAFYKSPLLKKQHIGTCSDCLTEDALVEAGSEDTLAELVLEVETSEL